jgi:ubiquinone/menaquinone biosynthesis C-methylase UbiE
MNVNDPRIEFFDQHAANWDAQGPSNAVILTRLDGLTASLGLRAGDDVLEVGCGTGGVTAWLLGQVAPGSVTSIDFSPEMIKHARQRGLDVKFRCADVCSHDLGRGVYDVAFCMHTVPHWRDQQAGLTNLAHALKLGGRLIVLHLNSRANINRLHDTAGGAIAGDHLPAPEQWPDLLTTAGLAMTDMIDEQDLFLVTAVR